MCVLIRAATIGQGAGFLDLRPSIRTAGARDIRHGPREFKRFNSENPLDAQTAIEKSGSRLEVDRDER